MADDETGWSEKGKRSGRGKRPPKDARVEDAAADVADATDEQATEVVQESATEPAGRSGEAETDAPSEPTRSASTTAAPSRPSRRPDAGSKPDGSAVVRSRSEDSGARKVARAAATAGQRDVSFLSRLGFPALIALICLLGVGVVFYAWTTRDALATPRQNIDHWHAVYGVYDCTQPGDDKYLPQFLSSQDDRGIHSHGDGIIHIHPFFELSSGENAQMRHFFHEMGIDVTPQAITLDSGQQLVAGTECADGSGPAEIRVLHWDFDFQALADPRTDPEVITDEFGQIRFENDREVYIIAFAAAGTDDDIPNPPSPRFDTLNNVSAAIEYEPTELIPRDTGVDISDESEEEAE